jgi:hypothetical protein
MSLLATVRVLSCKDSPPPVRAAVLPRKDAPSRRLTAEEELAYAPPPLPPALFPSMALPDTERVLWDTYRPPPLFSAMLPLTHAPSCRMAVDDE